jgi:metal-dependent HD superfamily phosphatase/phosphodiesterase
MRYLHDVNNNAYRADRVCLSAYFNSSTVERILIKIYYRRYTIGILPETRTSFIGNNNMADAWTCEVEATLEPLNTGY